MVVRVRPLSEKEINANYSNVIEVNEMNCCLTIKNPAGQEEEPPKMFTFDSVFGPDSTQVSVLFVLIYFLFNILIMPVVS